MAILKTPEQLEQERLFRERFGIDPTSDQPDTIYPSEIGRGIQLPEDLQQHASDIFPKLKQDPTQPLRDSIKEGAVNLFKRTPMGGNVPLPSEPEQESQDEILSDNRTPEEREQAKQAYLPKDLRGIPSKRYEMPEELKGRAFELFPALKDIVPGAKNQIPFAPEEPSQIPEEVTPEAIQQQQQQSPTDALPSRQHATIEAPQPDKQIAQAQQAQQEKADYEKAYEESQENAKLTRQLENMAKVRDAAIGVGKGSIYKGDMSVYEGMKEQDKEPLNKINIMQEMKSKAAKSDPNSDISKLTRKSLEELGMNMVGFENVSYDQIEKLYPSLAQNITNKLAMEARKEEAALNRQLRADNKEMANLQRVGASVEKQIQQLRTSKEFTSYEQAKTADALLQAAINSKQPLVKVEDAAGFMNYAKAAQGDDSVVRSEDMKVLAGNLGFNNVGEMLSKLSSKTKGSAFSQGELQAMSRVLGTIKRVKKEKIQQRLTPLRYTADKTGYDLSQNITPEYLDEIYAPEPPSIEEKAARLQELKRKQQEK